MRRAFRVRRNPVPGDWRWTCTLCHPPAHGCRRGWDAWERIIRVSLPHHMRVREYHHRHVLRTRGELLERGA